MFCHLGAYGNSDWPMISGRKSIVRHCGRLLAGLSALRTISGRRGDFSMGDSSSMALLRLSSSGGKNSSHMLNANTSPPEEHFRMTSKIASGWFMRRSVSLFVHKYTTTITVRCDARRDANGRALQPRRERANE